MTHHKANVYSLSGRILFCFLLFSTSVFSTNICGDILQNDTLKLAGSPYQLTCDVIIPVGVTLHIEPGVVVDLAHYSYDLIVHGTLVAEGTVTDSIRFYSSSGNGGGSVALLNGSVGNSLLYCEFENLGNEHTSSTFNDSAFDTGLYIEDAESTVDHCYFNNCGTSSGTRHVAAKATAVGGFGKSNDVYRIHFLTSSLDTTAFWPNADTSGFEYVMIGDHTVPADDTLVIDTGVVVNMSHFSYDLRVNGTLIAEGGEADPVRFFSSSGSGGGSVALLNGSVGNSLLYCEFENLGNEHTSSTFNDSAYDTGLYIEDAESTVDHCSFNNCGTGGGVRHVAAWASAVGGFGPSNDLFGIYFLNNTLDTTCVWPNVDTSGFEYRMNGDQVVPLGDTLTIALGVVVNLNHYSYDLKVNGTLKAKGTVSDSIRFYSSSGSGGGSVAFLDGSIGSTLLYCEFENLGNENVSSTFNDSAYDTGLYIGDAESTVDHCYFNNCGTGGGVRHIAAKATAVGGFGPSNDLFRIYFLTSSLDTTAHWPNVDTSGFEYVMIGDHTVPQGDTLTIAPGVVVNLSHYSYDLRVNGTLIAEGTVNDHVRFYSSAGSGGGSVALMNGSTGSSLLYCEFENLGNENVSSTFNDSAYDTGLYIEDAESTIDYCSFNNCGTGGGVRHIAAKATAVGGFGPSNDLFRIYFLTSSLDATALWPNVDTSGFEYVMIGDHTVSSGDTLTISPGVIVNLSHYSYDLKVNGTLKAEGTVSDSIRFYSSSGSGGGSVALLDDSMGNELLYCEFENLGNEHTSSTFNDSAYDTGLYIADTESTVNHCAFTNCGTGGGVRHVAARADAVSGFGNSNDLFRIYFHSSSLGKTATWPNADDNGFEYVVIGDQTLPENDSLTIDAGAVINVADRSYDLVINGTLSAKGNNQDSVHFYSSASNGGGSIVFTALSKNSEMSFCKVEDLGIHANSAYDVGIRIYTSDVLIEKSLLQNNIFGIYVDIGQPTIRFNSFKNNTSYGLYNLPANDTVFACNNWWGHASGPYNPTHNPGGLGDRISDKVVAANCHLIAPPDLIPVYVYNEVSCVDGNDGSIEVNVTGGQPPYTYAWSSGSTDSIATGLSVGDYMLTLTDDSGVQIEETVSLELMPYEVVISSPLAQIFSGNTTSILIKNVTTASWSNGDNGMNVSVNPTESTVYYVNGTTVSGCMYADSFSIEVLEPALFPAAPEVCLGQGVNLFVGALLDSFSMDMTAAVNHPFQTEAGAKYRILVNGVFTETVGCPVVGQFYDAAYYYNYGVVSTAVLSRMEPFYNIRPIVEAPNALHEYEYEIIGDGTPLDFKYTDSNYTDNCGSFEVKIYQINEGADISWTTADTTPVIQVFPTETTDYQYTLADCTSNCMDSVTVNVLPPAHIATSAPILFYDQLLVGQTALQNLMVYNTGCDSLFLDSLKISNGYFISSLPVNHLAPYDSVEMMVTFMPGIIGSNSAIMTIFNSDDDLDINLIGEGCTAVAPVISPSDTTICFGDTLVLSSSYADGNFWSTEDTTQTIMVLGAGEFLVQYTDSVGCTIDSDPVTITYLPEPSLMTAPATTLCIGDAAELWVENSQFNVWSTTEMTDTITVSPTDTTVYTVTTTNSAGCTYIYEQTISVIPAMPPDAVMGMFPDSGILNYPIPAQLSWPPANNASNYDVYIWADGQSPPPAPTISNTTLINVSYGSLNIFTTYHWKVVSKNSCFETEGPVQSFHTKGKPDLMVNSHVIPSYAFATNTIELTWEVKNIGNNGTEAGQWTDYIYLSTDLDLRTADDLLLDDFPNPSFLNTNDSYTQIKNITLPPGLTGVFYLFIITDNNDAFCSGYNACMTGPWRHHHSSIGESDEENNFVYEEFTIYPPPAPDLKILTVGGPTAAFGLDLITATYLVENDGEVGLDNQTWEDHIFLTTDSVLNEATSSALAVETVSETLLTDSTYLRMVQFQVPHSYFGTYFLHVKTDGGNNLFEYVYENNNVKTSPFPINVSLAIPPDLQANSLTIPPTGSSGKTISIQWTVENVGPNPPPESGWSDWVYISKLDTFNLDSAIFIGAKSVSNSPTLNAGDDYTFTHLVTLPNGTEGAYYVYLLADGGEDVFEYVNENNNIIRSANTMAVDLTPPPDLVVVDIDFPDTVYYDQSLTGSWAIENQGVGSATGAWKDGVYLSPFSTYNPSSAIYMGQQNNPKNLAINENYTQTGTFGWGDVTTGLYYVFISTDRNNNLYEHSNEGNNITGGSSHAIHVLPAIPPAPTFSDIEPIFFDFVDTTNSGEFLQATWTVKNHGPDKTTGSTWRDYVYLSTDTLIGGGDVLLSGFAGFNSPSSLDSGGVYSRTRSFVIPNGLSGDYYLIVKTNQNNKISNETSTNNNTAYKAVHINLTLAPDLVATGFTSPSTFFAGEQIKVHFIIENQGVGVTPASAWQDRVYLSSSATLSSGRVHIGSFNRSDTLGVGQSYSDSLTINVPSYLSGNYYLGIIADGNNANYEGAFENNNYSSIPVAVQPANFTDLIVSSVTVPPNQVLGKNMIVEYTLKNLDGTNSTIGTLKDNGYVSDNTSFEGDEDFLINTKSGYVNIPVGDSITRSITGKIINLDPGDFYGLIRTNTAAGIAESDDTNNLSASDTTLAITVPSLILDTLKNETLNYGDYLYYSVTVAAGLDLVIDLTSDQVVGLNEMFVSFGTVPTRNNAEFMTEVGGIDQTLLIPATQAGTYYILIQTQTSLAAPQNIGILARTLPFSILDTSPDYGGQGEVTTTITGAGFRDSIEVFLKDSLGSIAATGFVKNLTSSMEMQVLWDLTNVPLGIYDIVAKNPNGEEEMLEDAFRVEASTGFQAAFTKLGPELIRAGKSASYEFLIYNVGNVNIDFMTAELAWLKPVRAIGFELDERTTTSHIYTNALAVTEEYFYDEDYATVFPFLIKDLTPGDVAIVKMKFNDFLFSSFAVEMNFNGFSKSDYIQSELMKGEGLRQILSTDPATVTGYQPEFVNLILDQNGWKELVIQRMIEEAIISTEDTVNVDLNCDICTNGFNLVNNPDNFTYSAGANPGTREASSIICQSGEDYLWEINKYAGTAGQDPGWDLVHATGTITFSASPADPFFLRLSSLDYFNFKSYLAGWYPAVDNCWPIIIADQGIVDFDANEISIDTSGFTDFNELHGGSFSLARTNTLPDTLYLCFTSYQPSPGENGVPGALGASGEIGSPGGKGGPVLGPIPAGNGGKGGAGGDGLDGQPGGNGGPGGPGGDCDPNDPNSVAGEGGLGGEGGQGGLGAPGGTGGEGGPGGNCTNGTAGNGGTGGNGGNAGQREIEFNYENGPVPIFFGYPQVGRYGDGGVPGTGMQPGSYGNDGGNGIQATDRFEGLENAIEEFICTFVGDIICNETVRKVVDLANGLTDLKKGLKGIKGLWKAIRGGKVNRLKEFRNIVETSGIVPDKISCSIDAYTCAAAAGATAASGGGAAPLLVACKGIANCAYQYICDKVASSCDPNEIVGPSGYDTLHWVSAKEVLPYKIYFENDSTFAEVPAQTVEIRQQLHENVDPLTFRLGNFGFANLEFEIPEGRANYTTTLQLDEPAGLDVELTAGLDIINNEVFWILRAIDHNTGLPPYNPNIGVLPVNDTLGNGQGFVSYIILPKTTVGTGDSIQAQATIIFDINAPIVTNTVTNIIDAVAPTSSMATTVTVIDSVTFRLHWSAADDAGGCGIRDYELYVSENGEPFYLNETGITDTAAIFTRTPGKEYCFYIKAIDNVANVEEKTLMEICVCPLNRYVDNTPITDGIYRAELTLSSDQELAPNSDVSFYATQLIDLLPGFKVPLGAIFLAEIEGCPISAGSVKDGKVEEE